LKDVLKGKSESQIKSLKRRQNLFDKVLKSGKSIDEIKQLNRSEYNKLMGTKIGTKKEALKSQHRLLDQLNFHIQDVSIYHSDKNKIKDKEYRAFINRRGRELVQKDGQYTVVEVKYKDSSKWIKYDNKKNYLKQLQELESSYGDKYELIFYDFKTYESFIESEFRKTIKAKGVKV
jgi:hypothetical protein